MTGLAGILLLIIAGLLAGVALGAPGSGPATRATPPAGVVGAVPPAAARPGDSPGVWIRDDAPEGSIGGGGDINGDGFADLLIGEPAHANGHPTATGRVLIFLGSPYGFRVEPDLILQAQEAGGFGMSVAIVGDVNGDGFGDVGVVATAPLGGPHPDGWVALYHGSRDGVAAAPDWVLTGSPAVSSVRLVGAAGDVNGDGFADVVVHAYRSTETPPDAGVALVFHGSAHGLAKEPSWRRLGSQVDEQFGASVEAAGDVNGDGFGDLIVGSTHFDGREENDGKAELFYGSREGLSRDPVWTAVHVPPPSAHFAAGRNQLFGSPAGTAGDVNGDGFADLVVCGRYISNGEGNEGRAFVWHGSRDGLTAEPVWSAESDQAEALFGTVSTGVGDVNGDGFDDVLVSAPYLDRGELNEGLVALYHGSARGLSPWPAWTTEGHQPLALLGTLMVALGDVNGDALADFAIASGVRRREGRATREIRVYYGRRGGLANGTGWSPRVTSWSRATQGFQRLATQGGWRLAVAGAGAGLGVATALVWATVAARETGRRRDRLRQRMATLASLPWSGGSTGGPRWERLSTLLRGGLNPEAGAGSRVGDVVQESLDWAVEFARKREWVLRVQPTRAIGIDQTAGAEWSNCVRTVVRVGLANVAEHARASTAWLSIEFGADGVRIEIRDDGVGFDAAGWARRGGKATGAFGLASLQCRVGRLGGDFWVESQPGRGTRMEAILPWPERRVRGFWERIGRGKGQRV